jgi:hypothetical protein
LPVWAAIRPREKLSERKSSIIETAKFVSGREIIWSDNNSVLDRQRADQTISGASKKHKR